MIKVVDRVSLAELLVEADVVLRAVSSKSFSTSKSRKKKFDEKKECVVDDDENDDDDEDTANGPKESRRGGVFSGSFSTALTKRLRGAYLSFCSDTTATTRGTLTATTVVQKMMNSKDWLAVVTESRLLSKSFSARRAMRCFEDASIGCDERDDGDGMTSRRGIGFEQFVKLLAEDVAKAYDVDAKVVGKRVVATAYAIERRKEEEERRKKLDKTRERLAKREERRKRREERRARRRGKKFERSPTEVQTEAEEDLPEPVSKKYL